MAKGFLEAYSSITIMATAWQQSGRYDTEAAAESSHHDLQDGSTVRMM